MEEIEYKKRSEMWNNPMAKGLLVGKGRRGVVWMPSIRDEKKRYPFRPMQIRFLHAYSTGEDLQTICEKLEMSVEEAMKLLKRSKCREYLGELESMDAEVLARTSKDRIAHELLDVWDGKTKKDRQQIEAGKELWARLWPRPEKNSSHGDNFQININVGKIAEAFERQQAIEADNILESEA